MEMFEELKAIKAQVEAAGIDTQEVEADINGWYFIDTPYNPEYTCKQLNHAGFYCAPLTDMQHDGTWRYRISRIAAPTMQPEPPAPATAPAAGVVGDDGLPANDYDKGYDDGLTDGYESGEMESLARLGGEIASLEAELAETRQRLAAAEGALNKCESVLYSVGQRLPMTDSYKDINANRMELRKLAQDYFATTPALQAAQASDGGA